MCGLRQLTTAVFLRALLFWLTLTVAAGAIAFPAKPAEHARDAWTYTRCANEVGDGYRNQLPLTPDEEKRAADSPLWRRDFVPDAYRAEVDRAIERRCHEQPVDHPERRAAFAVAVLAGGALLLYWLLPHLSIRCRRLKAADPSEPPRPVDIAVHDLAAGAGVNAPMVLVNVVDTSVNAVAFGHRGRRYIEVSGGLENKLRLSGGRDVFEALVRHELGHIRNRDLEVTLAVTALWWGFVALVVGAFCLSLTGYADSATSLRELCLRLALLTGVVYAARNSFLQSRELHADRFAASCPSNGAGTTREVLDNILSTLAGARPGRAGETSVWPFGTHPSLARRRAALVRPVLADEFTGWELTLIGCLGLFAVNLVLGRSFELMMFALRIGLLDLADVSTLHPLYAWTAMPFLLVAGPVVALGVRNSVLAWGGLRALGPHMGARLAGLAACLWAGLCLGCLIYPGPIGRRDDTTAVMLWQTFTGAPALGLALASAAVVAFCALLALGCEAVRLRRSLAVALTAAYGALIAVVGFPTALPASTAVYLRAAALALPLAGALGLLTARRPPPAMCRRASGAGYGTGSVTVVSSPMRRPLRVLCHLITLGMTAWAVSTAARLLSDFAPSSLFTLVSQLGFVLYGCGIASASLAPHDTVFHQRMHTAVSCLAAAGLLLTLNLLAEGRTTPWLVLILLGPAAGVVIASATSAAALYDLRHRRGRAPDTARAAARVAS
ncbi:M48 family metallopeptidase [Streptomyces sp. NBC_00210]|uniref:M48 family metalloprotease n=1 Tax=Streptomyces sp. NBC_00210 TaxID=2903636 RepID=UPI00324305CD